MKIFSELNSDQLNSLSKLCFDISKVALELAILPADIFQREPILAIIRVIIALFWGLALVYIGLVLLKLKEKLK